LPVNRYYPKLDRLANRSDEEITALAKQSVPASVSPIANLPWMFGKICIIIETEKQRLAVTRINQNAKNQQRREMRLVQ